jgi:hypothetical protein
MPSAPPTDEEIAAWNELPRDEQLKRYRELFRHPDAMTVCGETMDEILAGAHRRRSAPPGCKPWGSMRLLIENYSRFDVSCGYDR